MIAKWQDVGFTHGVMNTDNMSVLGLTIDYGPFGFLDSFDPSYTPNTTDLPGRRYCFANQPDVGLWNVAQFTAALSTAELLSDEEADYALERYLKMLAFGHLLNCFVFVIARLFLLFAAVDVTLVISLDMVTNSWTITKIL